MKKGLFLLLLLAIATGVYFRFISSDQRAIRGTINHIANAAAANDPDLALSYTTNNAFKVRSQARLYLGMTKVLSAKITQFKVLSIDRNANPPTAQVQFTASVTINELVLGGQYLLLVHFDQVELIESPDKVWRVTDHFKYHLHGESPGEKKYQFRL